MPKLNNILILLAIRKVKSMVQNYTLQTLLLETNISLLLMMKTKLF